MDNLKQILKKENTYMVYATSWKISPEYRKIRKKEKNFLDLCFNSTLAAEISLQPIKRFNFDFIILFSDILVIPFALGQKVEFKESIGPILNKIEFSSDLDLSNRHEQIHKLDPIFKTIKILSKEKKDKQLIGFCGGPFTVLTYMLEGGTSKKHSIVKKK